ncbi:Type II secretory pathway, component ExeA,putative ATPase (plasmid) [Paraburkholderia caribensis MBA4]|uniref:Type II secretory pathway, component ExeA,putative ATPase n=1 Tax=Paraburkholderia caribensis MBA4 TaxID=1323664 RepID=A0A0P0RMQ0_9BURK|nr:ATP-binding protein [Paraburkholderia caribensis]ALL70127.1 Type II secretory pathway, component ExeA,putative ATPase [Paraburkholderia caribensis MBA4]
MSTNDIDTFKRIPNHLHPLFKDVDAIGTAALDELFTMLCLAIDTGSKSLAIAAPTGAGKTCAIQRITAELATVYPNVPVIIYNTLNFQATSVRGFFIHFLESLGHAVLSGETGRLRSRVVNFIIDLARQAGTSIVILMVDEAQVMFPEDVNFLKDVFNELQKGRVRLVTFMFGELPGFPNMVATWSDSVRARFVAHRTVLRGVKNVEDLKRILREIDIAAFSVGSDRTWTSTLFPKAYAGGFRLVSQAENFFACVTRETRGHASEIPTRAAFNAIRAFVGMHGDKDAAGLSFTQEDWVAPVRWAEVAEAVAVFNRNSTQDWALTI